MLGKPFIILSTVDSTNNHAMGLIREGKAADGTAIFALEQTEGKGQRGKVWDSHLGENILLTVIAGSKNLSIHQPFLLSAITALACCDFFSKYAGDETSIKWPNDLYWRDRKAGGILIENVIKNQQWDNTVIGMGININQTQFGQLENKTVSLKQITGKSFDPILLAEELCGFLDARLNQIKSTPAETIIEEYNKHLFKRNEKVKFRKDSLVFEAKVLRATAEGDLEIERGIVEKIHHGSVEWIL